MAKKTVDINEFNRCIEQSREWLAQNGKDVVCTSYGIKLKHLVSHRMKKVSQRIHKSNLGDVHVGYSFSVFRHPGNSEIEQRWTVLFDGSLILEHEKHVRGRIVKHRGRFTHRDRLWGKEDVI